MTSGIELQSHKTSPLYSWQFVVILLFLLALLGVKIEKPTGSISGQLALQQEGFDLYSYDMREHRVHAIAIGPRNGNTQERGVWVSKDGSFKIDNLPVGEYELKVHVPGFATSYDSGIFVEEGKATTLGHDIALEISAPSVTLASNTRVFTTKEQPRFWANTNSSSQITINVYKQDLLPLLSRDSKTQLGFEITPELSIYKPYDAPNKKTVAQFFKSMSALQTWTRALATDQNDYAREEFKFDKPLAPGDYFAVAQVSNVQHKQDWNIIWFSVSDVGLIVKRDAERAVVRAIDLNTLQPLSSVPVQLLDRSNRARLLAKGSTGKDGFVSIPVPKVRAAASGESGSGEQTADQVASSLIAYGAVGASHAFGGLNFYSGTADAYQTYFYTDRPVYRLGQTVYYKGICRARQGNGFKNPGQLKLSAFIEDPDNNQIWSGKLLTSSHGTFHGIFEVPKDSKTGAYQMTVKFPDGTQSYERFEVAEYRKPEYLVEVIPTQSRIIAGSRGKARIHAAYYFGAPVANAKVKYTIFSLIDWSSRYSLMDRPGYYGFYDGWDSEGEEYGESDYNGDYVTEGTAVTDENGDAIVEFDTKRAVFDKDKPYEYDRYDHRYKVEAEVTDISRLSVLGSGSVAVTQGNFALFVTPANYIAKVGEPISADFDVVSYDAQHRPLANVPVNLKLYRRVYDHKTYSYKGIETYEDVTVTSDEHGKGHVNFKTKPEFVTDNYDIIAIARDTASNAVVDDASVWVVSENAPYSLANDQAAKEPLMVKLDKPVYKPGETAKVMITAPVTGTEGAEAIVCVEGAKLYSYRAIPMRATAQLVEIPLSLDYAPNVYVTVTFVGKKHQFYNQTEMIKVSPENRFLNLAIACDKPKYKPGEQATYTVTAKYADGKPAANTEISLGVVDESIYAVRPEAAPDIRKFFYSKRENVVVTACTFPEQYSGGPNKIEPRVRKDFRDTAAWLPDLVTNKEGVVKTAIKLPDNLTTWRATARAVSMATEVGASVQKVVSTQDLILRLAMPRFFLQGDEGYLTAVVHNYTDKPQGVKLTLSPSDQFQVQQNLEQKLVVFPDKALRYSWPVKVMAPGNALVACKAVGDTAADAMEMHIPINPLGVESFATKSGIITADDATINLPVDLPADAVPSSVKTHLLLSSSSIGPLLGNFNSLIDYPYGCTEQTMSKLMPSIVAIRLHQALGAPLTKADQDKFKQVYNLSMTKLSSYQHDDGGWGWWADDQSQLYLSALVLDGYSMLKQAGYAVPEDRQTNGKAWLIKNAHEGFKQLTDKAHKPVLWTDRETTIDIARAYYVLSKLGEKLPGDVRLWALQQRGGMTPEALSYFVLAANKEQDGESARAFYDRLIELSNSLSADTGTMVDWAPSKQMFEKLHWGINSGNFYYSYRFTDVETTCLALQAVLAVESNNFDRVEAIKRWILTQRTQAGWDNTKTTAEVFKTLMTAELASRKSAPDTNFIAGVVTGGRELSPLSFDSQSQFKKEVDLLIPSAKGRQLTLHKKGVGRLYYSVSVSYYRSIKPGQFLAQKAMPEGLKVTRDFFRLVASVPDSNGNVHFSAVPLKDKTVRAGETVLMKVYVESPTPVPYVYIRAPLPSGAEVVENDSRESAKEEGSSENKDDAYTWGSWWWNHQDVMDDHLAFFVTSFPTGRCELHQMVRMEIPGKFGLNPVELAGMYTKAVRGYSQNDQITVVEK